MLNTLRNWLPKYTPVPATFFSIHSAPQNATTATQAKSSTKTFEDIPSAAQTNFTPASPQ